jgi:uncharacterized protein (DUF983 family)
MQAALIVLAVFGLVFVGVALLIPAGIPAPVYAVIALVAIAPGCVAGWLLYRRRVKQGEVPPLGEELVEGDAGRAGPTGGGNP